MESTLTQLILTGGAVISAVFVTIRYAMNQTAKREKALLEHTQKTQESMLQYFETKNGHMERMAKDFTMASNKMGLALNKLSGEIKVLNSKHK